MYIFGNNGQMYRKFILNPHNIWEPLIEHFCSIKISDMSYGTKTSKLIVERSISWIDGDIRFTSPQKIRSELSGKDTWYNWQGVWSESASEWNYQESAASITLSGKTREYIL